MNAKKTFWGAMLFSAFSLPSFSQTDNTGTYIDQEVIPYNLMQMNMGLTYSQFTQYSYESYTMDGPDPYNPNLISPIPYTTLNKISTLGMGAGLDLHVPLVYLLCHNKERRFRIADDLGIGTYMTSNKITRRNVLTNDKLVVSENATPKINGSIIFYLGIQAVFRINRTFDIGAKYYPVFLHYDYANPGAFGQTFGFSARVQHVYLDFQHTNRKDKSMIVNKGFNKMILHYALPQKNKDKAQNYLTLQVSNFIYQYQIFAPGQTPPEYENYKIKNNNWTLIQFGWGLGF